MIIIVMIVNAVGIAQVTHICKMAVNGMEKGDCHGTSSDVHSCCMANEESNSHKKPTDKDCCTDVIKYFHQTVNTTLQQHFKVQISNFFISLFAVPVLIPESKELTSFLGKVIFPKKINGRTIILDIKTLLI